MSPTITWVGDLFCQARLCICKCKKRDFVLLNNFIGYCLEPPESWTLYPVDVREGADRELQCSCNNFHSY